MRILKNGFTVAEMLICLGIISVVVAIMIPAATSKKPNKNRALFRKSYYNFERAIAELVNDESVFPVVRSIDVAADKDPSTLFGYFIPNATERARTENKVPISGMGDDLQERSIANTSRYLCSQIAEHMNTNGVVDCSVSRSLPGEGVPAREFPVGDTEDEDEDEIPAVNSPNFVTNDGVAWFTDAATHPICARELQRDGVNFAPRGVGIAACEHQMDESGRNLKFPIEASSDYTCYEVDVNGPERPNRRLGLDPDRFRFCVTFDGKVEVPLTEFIEDPETHEKRVSPNSGHEAEYLQSNKIVE